MPCGIRNTGYALVCSRHLSAISIFNSCTWHSEAGEIPTGCSTLHSQALRYLPSTKKFKPAVTIPKSNASYSQIINQTMKVYHILTLAFISGTIILNAQTTQSRPVSSFNKIEISGSANVLYSPADTLSLAVKAKENELDRVETRVENNTLYIHNRGKFTQAVNVYVKHNGELNDVMASGAASFKTTGVIKSDNVFFNVSGSAAINGSVACVKLKSIQSGASMLNLAGTADQFNAELSGASSLRAYHLVSKTTDIISTGAATSRVYVTGKLTANASGASDIKVKGPVTDISAEASTASSIARVTENNSDSEDSTFFNLKRKKIIIIEKGKDEDVAGADSSLINKKSYDADEFKHWTGFSMGVNGWMKSPGDIALPARDSYMEVDYARSFNFQFNIIERQLNLVQNYVKIITGFGIDYHSYQLAGKVTLNPDSSYTSGITDSTNMYTFKKNRLRNTYLQVPLLLEFNTSNDPEKTFHIAFGVIGQYRIASRTKQTYTDGDNYAYKKTRKDSYNMAPFAAKAHVNLGYRGWTVYGEYSLTPLFASGKGPELYPFTVGIRLVPFS